MNTCDRGNEDNRRKFLSGVDLAPVGGMHKQSKVDRIILTRSHLGSVVLRLWERQRFGAMASKTAQATATAAAAALPAKAQRRQEKRTGKNGNTDAKTKEGPM